MGCGYVQTVVVVEPPVWTDCSMWEVCFAGNCVTSDTYTAMDVWTMLDGYVGLSAVCVEQGALVIKRVPLQQQQD